MDEQFSCRIDEQSGNFVAHVYTINGTYIGIQDIDPRAVLIDDDGERSDNENAGLPFTSEDHVKEWLASEYRDQGIEFLPVKADHDNLVDSVDITPEPVEE